MFIGGLFNTELEERVFQFAVDFVNARNLIGHDIQLDYIANITDSTGLSAFENIQLGEF